MNLFTILKRNYGQPAIYKLRKWENTSNKLARARIALIFSLRCKDTDVIPVYLRIKTTIRGRNAQNIIRSTQKKLLRESIRLTSQKIKKLTQDLQVAEADFIDHVSSNNRAERIIEQSPNTCTSPITTTNMTDLDPIVEVSRRHVTAITEATHAQTKQKQQKKLENLKNSDKNGKKRR